ncbi:hypothetical protein [Alkalihalobacillus sp. AL-G]|uniref:hypothetical protein n=1 Tax=Alkalihalobacillus sp. AL-G TaxID=2926399 RepID=UPI00272B33CB|nr:hypothetical protein [Alkalihalobacillus sp. AL-G]WLD92637.1 hypothetical protein MOJ78_16705 [Alkalihalobacillus sp. AL-G]
MIMFDFKNSAIQVNMAKTVASLEVELIAQDFGGEVNITDLILQGGQIATNWTLHPSEIRWSIDG